MAEMMFQRLKDCHHPSHTRHTTHTQPAATGTQHTHPPHSNVVPFFLALDEVDLNFPTVVII